MTVSTPPPALATACGLALVATLLPLGLAAALTPRDEPIALESVDIITLGGADPALSATAPRSCDRRASLTMGAHEFTCGDVTVVTRSAEDVKDLPRFGVRAIRAATFATATPPDMTRAEVDEGLRAWTGGPTSVGDTAYSVIVLGERSGANALVAVLSGLEGAVTDTTSAMLSDVRRVP